MNYRFADKQKTLGFGCVSGDVSLASARERREARPVKLLANDIDPSVAKREAKQPRRTRRQTPLKRWRGTGWTRQPRKRAAITQLKVKTWLEKDAFPFIGNMPISTIGPRDVLDKVVRKLEARGAIDTAHRLKQVMRPSVPVCGCHRAGRT
jgi:hypothetical protein